MSPAATRPHAASISASAGSVNFSHRIVASLTRPLPLARPNFQQRNRAVDPRKLLAD